MDLAELKFVVDTKQLEDAATKVAELGAAVSKLNKPVTDAALKSEKLAKVQAEVAEKAAKAALAQLKLQQAQEESTTATGKSVSVLERQNMILGYMATGLSKGQASYMATAKAAGALGDELEQLETTLKTQRSLIGGDAFDKSIGLMQKLSNETKITAEVNRLFNQSLALTEKQMIELAREKERLIALYNHEKRSLDGLDAEYQQIINKSVELNSLNDARTNSMRQQVKAQNDAAKANEYIAKEMERVNRLNSEGADITSATNNKLIRFEKELRASGLSAAEAATQLTLYKNALLSAQKVAGNRQVDYLSRALGPQITDIAVGLATGQAPLTILLQQGGQLRDQFALAGVAGADMGKMLIQASKAMVSSVKDVGLAVGQVFVGAITGSGKVVTNFAMQITGANIALDALRKIIITTDGASSAAIATFDKLGKVITVGMGVGVFAAIGLLIGLVVQYSKVVAAEKELTASLAMSGAALAMSTEDAIKYAESMNAVGVGTMDAMRMIAEFANTGADASIPLEQIITSAQDMQKYVGIASADTMKAFADISEKPVEGLIKLAKSTGNVTAETILQAEAAIKAGNSAEAARIAQEALSNSNSEVVKRMKNNLDPLQTLWMDIKSGISQAGEALYDFLKSSTTVAVFRTVWETIAVIVTEVWYVLKQTGNEISGIFSQIKAVMSGDFAGAKRIGDQMKIDAAAAREEQDKLVASIMNRNKAEKETLTITEEQRKANRKAAKEIEERLKNQKAATFTIPEDTGLKDIQNKHKIAMDSINAESSKMISANKVEYALGLKDVGDYMTEEIQLIVDFNNKRVNENNSYIEKLNASEKLQIKAIQDAIGVAKSHAKTKEDTMALDKQLTNSVNSVKESYNRLRDSVKGANDQFADKSAEAQMKAIENIGQYTKKAVEGSKEFARTLDDTAAKRKLQIELEGQLANLTGADLVRVKAQIDAEQSHIAKLSELEKAALQARVAMSKLTLSGLDPNDPKYQNAVTAIKNANDSLEQAKVKSRQEIVQAGIDAEMMYYQQEYKRLNDSITDGIITALFEGGKAGSKKLRDLIVAELKKPITIVVKALVDATLGNFIQSVVGGGGGSFAGSAAGSAATGGLSNMTIGGASISSLGTSFGQGVSSGFGFGGNAIASIEAGSVNATAFNMGGTYGAPVAGVLAGVYGGRAVSGGYSAMGGASGNSAVNIGTAIGLAIAGPLGAALGGLAGGAFNRTFGRKLTDVGIRGTLGGEAGFQGERYTFEKGGFLRSDKTRTSVLEEADRSAIASDFRLIKTSVMDLADSAGFGSDAIKDFTTKFQINLKGLSPEDAVKRYQEEFAKIEESMAKAVIGTSGYRRENETNIQALTRISGFMKGVNSAFEKLGFETYKLELASLDAAQSFVDMFGGIEGFSQAMSFFYENFFTDTEKTANLTKDLTTAFGKLGLELPSTREAFRALVVAAKEAGDDQQVKNLLDLQQAFAQLVPVTEMVVGVVDVLTETMKGLLKERSNLEVELLQVQGRTDEANAALRRIATEGFTEAEIAAYDYNQSLRLQIQAYKDAKIAAKANTDDAYAALEKSVNAEKTRLDSEISAVRIRENLTRESIASINNLFEILDDNIKSLYSEVNSTSNMQFSAARGLITQSLATARSTGYLPDGDQLSDAIGTVRTQLEKNQYKSKVDAERDRLLLALELQALQEITDTQLSIEEKMLKGIEDQLKSLNDQKLTLDDLLINARDQLQSSRDINTSVINLQTAITNLATAISAEAAARVEAANIAANASSASQQAASATAYAISSGSTYNASSATPVSSREQEIADIYNTVLGRSADVTGLENWVKSAMSSDEIKNAIANSAEAQARAISVEAQNQWIQQVTKEMGISTDIVARANGGYTPAGMTLVGEQGPELVNFNRPGMVYTAAQSAALMGGSSEELAAIRQELIMLRAETRAVVNNTSKAAKILDRSSPDGQSLQVTVLAA